jgi:hypothetical protein
LAITSSCLIASAAAAWLSTTAAAAYQPENAPQAHQARACPPGEGADVNKYLRQPPLDPL